MSVEQLEAEIEALLSDLDDETAALARANGKLFEAGKFAGQQQAKITAALGYLEKASSNMAPTVPNTGGLNRPLPSPWASGPNNRPPGGFCVAWAAQGPGQRDLAVRRDGHRRACGGTMPPKPTPDSDVPPADWRDHLEGFEDGWDETWEGEFFEDEDIRSA